MNHMGSLCILPCPHYIKEPITSFVISQLLLLGYLSFSTAGLQIQGVGHALEAYKLYSSTRNLLEKQFSSPKEIRIVNKRIKVLIIGNDIKCVHYCFYLLSPGPVHKFY